MSETGGRQSNVAGDLGQEVGERPARRDLISIIAPVRNEIRHIGALVASLESFKADGFDLEILIADGRSDDGTREALDEYAASRPGVTIVDNPEKTVPYGLNRAIRLAKGDFICRMDAHSTYPADYVQRLYELARATGAENVGGRVWTRPAEDTAEARAVIFALSHPLGVGGSGFRTLTSGEPREVDTVPFGFFPRATFDRFGLFDEEMTRSQDAEFNARIRRGGGRIVMDPELVITYFGRSRFPALRRMMFQYGKYKALASVKAGQPLAWRQLVPPAFVLYLIGLIVSLPFTPREPAMALLSFALLVVYLAATAGAGWRGAGRELPGASLGARLEQAAKNMAALQITHVSYGVGYWVGLFGSPSWMRAWSFKRELAVNH